MKHFPSNNYDVWFIVGFVEGEGSFNISFRKKTDYKITWQPVLSFNVSQKERTILDFLKEFFQCGIIKQRRDGLHSYDVTNPRELKENIVPCFEKYQFMSESKRYNFELFKEAVELMFAKKHLEPKGLRELVHIREKINPGAGRTRKYSAQDILVESSETTR